MPEEFKRIWGIVFLIAVLAFAVREYNLPDRVTQAQIELSNAIFERDNPD